MPSASNDEFDWDAFHRDTRVLSPDARGAWWDCLYHQRLSPTWGRISMPVTSYARIFGVSPPEAKRLIEEIATHGVGEVVTESNGKVTVTNRRMFRQWQERQGNKKRQADYRERHANNERNGKVTESDKPPLVEEDVNKNEEKTNRRKRGAGTRIPDPFPLSDEKIGWARTNCPGLRLIDAHENFVEYWTNNTTAKAYKLDWDKTWQKGMRMALKWQIAEAAKDEGNRVKGQVGKSTDEPTEEFKPNCSTCHDIQKVWDTFQMVDCPDCKVKVAA